jgi:hypothetical protein
MGELGPMRLATVVEPRRDIDLEGHLAADTPQHPNQPMIVGRTPLHWWHEMVA